ncbi:hypothetical protein CR513_20665, partial [Mucuna pruriens]
MNDKRNEYKLGPVSNSNNRGGGSSRNAEDIDGAAEIGDIIDEEEEIQWLDVRSGIRFFKQGYWSCLVARRQTISLHELSTQALSKQAQRKSVYKRELMASIYKPGYDNKAVDAFSCQMMYVAISRADMEEWEKWE